MLIAANWEDVQGPARDRRSSWNRVRAAGWSRRGDLSAVPVTAGPRSSTAPPSTRRTSTGRREAAYTGDAELEQHPGRDPPRRCRRLAPPNGRSARRRWRGARPRPAATGTADRSPRRPHPAARTRPGTPPLAQALEHLPVGGDQHRSASRSRRRRAAPCLRAARARRPRRSTARRHGRHSPAPRRTGGVGAADDGEPSTRATASATAFVPSAKRGHSKTPIGPFQNTVRARPMRSPKSRRASGPMSSPSQPSGSSS